nr:unnamed protein product [Spirometra erinaceieuropaei]
MLEVRMNFMSHRVMENWDKLPDSVVLAESALVDFVSSVFGCFCVNIGHDCLVEVNSRLRHRNMSTSEANTRRRVKLYMLNEERQWDDKGTGHVSALYTEQNNIALVVISETDGSCLLESKIQSDTAYQKQQETLIVWSEGDNMDLALSFQEKAGCDDIWEKICRVQELFISNGHRYNMIDSAIIELFDYIRAENINLLITHVVEKHWDSLKDITYVQTFAGLKERYDALHRPSRTDSPLVFGQQGSINVFPLRTATNARFHRTTAEFDDEEEQWFGQDDDDDEEESSPTGNLTRAGVSSDAQSGGGSGALLSTPLGSSIDSLVYCRAPMLSMTASLSSPPSSLDRTATSTGDDEKLEKKSPERTLPTHGLIPLHERTGPERIDSPHPLRHSLLRQSAPISIHIKSTILNGNSCSDAANKTASVVMESSEIEVDNSVNSKGSKSEGISMRDEDEDAEVDNGEEEEEEEDGEASKNKTAGAASSRLVRHAAKRSRMLPNKHGKRPAVAAAKDPDETTLDGDASVTPATSEKADGIVGLVDYSDEESDEDTEDSEPENAESTVSPGATTLSSPPAVSDATNCSTTEGVLPADPQLSEVKSPLAPSQTSEVEAS